MKEFNPPYFIYTGNAYPHKNLERAIKAIINLKVVFCIVSSRNIFTKRLEKFIEKNNGQSYIKLLGFVDDKELNELYKNSVGFIFPSLMEGFGLPGLESLKAGTILLASDIPVFREIYGNHAIYFNPTNIVSIENAIKKTLSLTKVEGNKMIKENKKFIKRYSWKKMAEETLEVYETALL